MNKGLFLIFFSLLAQATTTAYLQSGDLKIVTAAPPIPVKVLTVEKNVTDFKLADEYVAFRKSSSLFVCPNADDEARFDHVADNVINYDIGRYRVAYTTESGETMIYDVGSKATLRLGKDVSHVEMDK